LGFALGYERCVLALEALGAKASSEVAPAAFIACVDDSTRATAFNLAQELRAQGLYVEVDHQKRSLKSQFKLADKLSARKVIVLGPDEVAEGVAKIRDMETHEEQAVKLDAVAGALA
jgi:histidyl-tRNA synthetase